MRLMLSILSFLGFLNSSFGQVSSPKGQLRGLILDKFSQQPLLGVVISIPELNLSCQSNEEGLFELEQIPVGRYTLIVDYPGYQSVQLPHQSILQNKTHYVPIELEEDLRLLSEIQVSAFRFENSRRHPISTFSFSRDEIALNPGAQGDIFRAIGMLPGVSSSGGVYSAIAVRGQGVRDNVYLVDDIPLTEVGHLEGNSFFNDPNGGRFSIFAPRVVDHALFQAGAFGVENGRRSASFLSLSLKEGNRVSPVYDGQIDLLGLNINYDGPSWIAPKTSLFISARYQNFYPLVRLIGLENLGLPSYGDFLLKSSTELNARNKLQVLFLFCPERFVRDLDNVQAKDGLNLLYLPDFKRSKTVLGLNLKTSINNKLQWKNILYFTNYSSDVQIGKAYPSINHLGELNVFDVPSNPRLQTQRYRENKWGFRSLLETSLSTKHRLVLGLEADVLQLINERNLLANDTNFIFRRSQVWPSNQLYQVISPNLINAAFNDWGLNTSAFANYYLDLGARFSAQFGLRLDYTEFSQQFVLAPRTNLSYHFNEAHSLNLGLGIFYQDPVYADIADLTRGQTLKMERVNQYILAYKGHFRQGFKLMIEAWYKQFDKLVTSPVNGSVLRNNLGTGYGQGLDLSLTKRLSQNWHGMASYSYMQAKRNDHDGLGEYNFMFSQPHQLNLLLSYQLGQAWSFSAKYRYATGRPTDRFIVHENILNDSNHYIYSMELIGRNLNRLPNFSSLDLRVNYMFNLKRIKLTAFVDVVNVLNRQIANTEGFNHLTGRTYYDGLAIFPTGGLKFEL